MIGKQSCFHIQSQDLYPTQHAKPLNDVTQWQLWSLSQWSNVDENEFEIDFSSEVKNRHSTLSQVYSRVNIITLVYRL